MRRKTKKELEQAKANKEAEKRHMARLTDSEAFLKSKRKRIEDIPKLVKENEELISYLSSKQLLDKDGHLLP